MKMNFSEPIVLKPGDMLRTTCHFNAHNKSTTTFYGPGTCDEMCYGFITYYPLQNMPDPECTAWKSLLGCDPSTLKGCDPHAFFTDITTFAKSEVYSNITSACKVFGLCQTECKRAIREARSREPCMRNEDYWHSLKWGGLGYSVEGGTFLGCIESCELDIYREDEENQMTSEADVLSLAVLDRFVSDW